MKIPFYSAFWNSRSVRQKKIYIFILVGGFIFVGKYWFGSGEQAAVDSTKLVEVLQIKTQPLQQTINLLGTIHPKHAATLVAKGAGLLDSLIPTGEKISKGMLIAKIENSDLEKNLQLSIKAEALAKAQFDRLRPLLKSGYVSAKEVEEKKREWIDAQKELSKTNIELDNLRFYAPFDGIVGAYKKREGAQVNQGEALVVVYDPSSLVVDFDIPCSNLSAIHEGQRVYVLGKKYALSHVQRMLDEDTHMCPADVDITCQKCLIGATVDIDLVVAEKKDAIVIPFQALFLKHSKPFVYIVKQGKVVLVPVKTGIQQHDQIEITAGLEPGQQLIIKGQDRLYPTLAVEIYTPRV